LINPANSGFFFKSSFFIFSLSFLTSLASASAETARAFLISEGRFFLSSISIETQGLFKRLKNFVESRLVAKKMLPNPSEDANATRFVYGILSFCVAITAYFCDSKRFFILFKISRLICSPQSFDKL